MGNFLCGVERAKRFVKIHLHCIVRNLKKYKRNVDVAKPSGKISADAHERACKTMNRLSTTASSKPNKAFQYHAQ